MCFDLLHWWMFLSSSYFSLYCCWRVYQFKIKIFGQIMRCLRNVQPQYLWYQNVLAPSSAFQFLPLNCSWRTLSWCIFNQECHLPLSTVCIQWIICWCGIFGNMSPVKHQKFTIAYHHIQKWWDVRVLDEVLSLSKFFTIKSFTLQVHYIQKYYKRFI